jgi:hypothetical protein
LREKKRNEYKILVEKPEEKRPLGRLESRWEDNIKMDVTDIRFRVADWIRCEAVLGSRLRANEVSGSMKG